MGITKIEKINADIAKAKARIEDFTAKASELTAKLRELEKMKINVENEEIIALFRREKLSEDEFAALLRTQRKNETTVDNDDAETLIGEQIDVTQEDVQDNNNEMEENQNYEE
jgi:DNA-binding transcriptional regulator YiaG